MKKILLIFVGVLMCAGSFEANAVSVKKAAPVTAKKATLADSAASSNLVSTVVGLVSGVQQLTQKQKALEADCVPSAQEISFVDNMMKEWAKTGAATAEEVKKRLGREPGNVFNGAYANSVQMAGGADEGGIYYDWFGSESDKNTVWYKFPKVGVAEYCDDGSMNCSAKDRKRASDIYDLFNLIDFSAADYTTPTEVTMAARLMNKIEKCSYSRLSAQKRAMWGEFLMESVGGLGQKTNTDTIMQMVGSVGTSPMGALQSLGAMATQFVQ